MLNRSWRILLVGCLLACCGLQPLLAAQLQVLLPLGRIAYQTNEYISLAVVRSDAQALPAAELTLTVIGDNASKLTFTFPVKAVPVQGNEARTTDHFQLNGWLLRPGRYTVEAAAYDAAASTTIEVYSHERRSSFKLINWGRANDKGKTPLEQVQDGEDGFGFNIFYAHYGGNDQNANIRGGVDYFPCCTQSGGHQMDLRMECDWSDPYVLGGGRARVSRRALVERTNPNCLGIHFYDEPGLTWWFDPVAGESTNNSVPAQMRSYKSAFGSEPLHYKKLDPTDPAQMRQWREFARWKISLMEAAWQDAKQAVEYVKPDFLTATQSQYGWMALSDGYYFNITRDLSVSSGHGGYHDWGPGYWHPSFTMEIARARDFSKPCWYLPAWYGNTTSDHFRLEQYLSFQTNIQGMITPPDLEPTRNPGGRNGITESNKLMARLGTIFTTMPVTRGPVAILYSLSDFINAQAKNPSKVHYAQQYKHGEHLQYSYIATKLLQQQAQFVVDEDLVDGTLQDNYKAVVLTSIDYLDPEVVTALEQYSANGGLVLLTADSEVKLNGAVKLEVTPGLPAENSTKAAALKEKLLPLQQQVAAIDAKAAPLRARLKLKDISKEEKDQLNADIKKLEEEKAPLAAQLKDRQMEASSFTAMRGVIQGAMVLAKAMKLQFDKAGITPVFTCDEPGIAATVQGQDDVQYIFAVNASHDFQSPNGQLGLRAAQATLTLADDGRTLYDAVRGGTVEELQKKGNAWAGAFRFGPGQLRVFARVARPIGAVQVVKPVVTRDLTLEKAPLQLRVRALVQDAQGGVLCGAFPLRIRVIDGLGAPRYDLYRATKDGLLDTTVTLAGNDPAGAWRVEVTELLNNTAGSAAFTFAPLSYAGAMAGQAERALYFGNDRQHIQRFFRTHKDVLLVKGTSPYLNEAAARLAESLKPWGVRCQIVNAADVSKPEPKPDDLELFDKTKTAKNPTGSTWCGPGGFDVAGPAILLGNPEDNALIKSFNDWKVLPYVPKRDEFPGRGRGMIAWQLDCVRQGVESITLIAYDAEGMAEAVGSMYAAAAAQDPILPLAQPRLATITAATKAQALPEAKVAWRTNLPDCADQMVVDGGKIVVTTHDGSQSILDGTGTLQSRQPVQAIPTLAAAPVKVPEALKTVALDSKLPKAILTDGNLTAIAYWGGTLQVVDAAGTVKCQQLLPQDISALAWANGTLVVALAEGQVLGLTIP